MLINEKECYKKFNKIVLGKEGEGYCEWKDWVEKEVVSYDECKIKNALKRYEIKLSNLENKKDIDICGIINQSVPLFIALMPIIVSIFSPLITSMVGITNSGNNKNAQYISNMGEILNEWCEGVLEIIEIISIICIVLIGIAYIVNYICCTHIAKKKTYYTMIIEILTNVYKS